MFDELPIRRIRLSPGRTVGAPPQDLILGGLTVFVGPNNSGKSLILREIATYAQNPADRTPRVIVEDFELTPLSDEEIDFVRRRVEINPPRNQAPRYKEFYIKHRGGSQYIGEQHFSLCMKNPINQDVAFRQFYLGNFTINLDGESRIRLVNPQQMGDLQNPEPMVALQVLFSNDETRHQIRDILYRAFDAYFVIDPTNNGHLTIRYSKRPPCDPQEEQGLHKAARDFHAAANTIANLSDGVKAYTGILTEIVAGQPSCLNR